MRSKAVILFIDEQVSDVEPVMDVLSDRIGDTQVVHKQSSTMGIQYLRENESKVAGVSLDLLMPHRLIKTTKDRDKFVVEGLAVLTKIREEFPSTKVVCYSWVNDADVVRRIRNMNVEYLYKPDRDAYRKLISILSNWHESYSAHLEV